MNIINEKESIRCESQRYEQKKYTSKNFKKQEPKDDNALEFFMNLVEESNVLTYEEKTFNVVETLKDQTKLLLKQTKQDSKIAQKRLARRKKMKQIKKAKKNLFSKKRISDVKYWKIKEAPTFFGSGSNVSNLNKRKKAEKNKKERFFAKKEISKELEFYFLAPKNQASVIDFSKKNNKNKTSVFQKKQKELSVV